MSTVDLSRITYYVVATLTNGSQINLENVAENIAWEENENELAVRLNLALRDVPYGSGRLSAVLALCTMITLSADWGDGKQEIFRGTVWEWGHSQVHDDQFTLTVYDLLFRLQKSSDSRYYTKGKTTKSIVSDILESWELTLGEYSAANVTHQKLLYKNKTVSVMLFDTLKDAERLGGAKSIIRARLGLVDVIKRGTNTDIYSFTQDTNLTQSSDRYTIVNLVTRVLVYGKDDSDGRPKVETSLDGKTEYGIMQQTVQIGSGTLAEAKSEAQKLLDEKGSPSRTIKLQSPDFPAIRKGDIIHAKTDGLSGYFFVKSVSHNATTMMMLMEVEPRG